MSASCFTCKDKWWSIYDHFKKKIDCMVGTSHNENYWSLNLQEKRASHLPCNFGHGVYDMIKEFMGTWPILTPPHVKDLMVDGDEVYKPHDHTLEDAIHLNDDSKIEKT